MSKVRVRIVVEETLRYDQIIELTQEDFEELEEGIPFTQSEICEYLDRADVTCLDCDIQRFEIVEEEA